MFSIFTVTSTLPIVSVPIMPSLSEEIDDHIIGNDTTFGPPCRTRPGCRRSLYSCSKYRSELITGFGAVWPRPHKLVSRTMPHGLTSLVGWVERRRGPAASVRHSSVGLAAARPTLLVTRSSLFSCSPVADWPPTRDNLPHRLTPASRGSLMRFRG